METKNFFVKRSGTTDFGKDYEDLLTMYLSLKYLQLAEHNQEFAEFLLSSNNDKYGIFDDVIIELDDIKKFAIQAKHVINSEKSSLPTKLGAASGQFSIYKYCTEFHNLSTTGFDFILLTNYKLEIPEDGLNIKLLPEDIDVKIVRATHYLDIFQKTNWCFKLQPINPGNTKYEKFFENFYLFANMPDVFEVEKIIYDEFKEKFDEVQLLQCLKFIGQWSKREGKKNILDKVFLPKALVVHMLSHVIKPYILNFDETFQRAEILRNIISQFAITVASEKNVEIVQKLWGNFDQELGSMDDINYVGRQYYILKEKIQDFRQLIGEIKTKLLWLDNKYPLIIGGFKHTYEVIKLCPTHKYIILADTFNDGDVGCVRIFRRLNDLDENSVDYKNLLSTFYCLLRDNKRISLEELLANNSDLKNLLNTNHLLQMVHGSFSMDEIVTLLVESTPQLNQLYQEGYTPIHIACLQNNLRLVKLIVQSNMNLSGASKDGDSPIFIACSNGNKEIIDLLLNSEVDVNIANKDGETPLLIACQKRNIDLVKKLLKAKANVNIVTKDGDSLLQFAAISGDAKLVKQFLKYNVNIDGSNKDGNTALYLAASNGYDKVVKYLIKGGAKLDGSGKDGETALFTAALGGHTEVVRLLCEAKALLNGSNKDANTALHVAYSKGHKKIVKILIAHGASETLENVNGLKPADMRK